MCGIAGFIKLSSNNSSVNQSDAGTDEDSAYPFITYSRNFRRDFLRILEKTSERGLDAFGAVYTNSDETTRTFKTGLEFIPPYADFKKGYRLSKVKNFVNDMFDESPKVCLVNFRGIPTTEAGGKILTREEIQPFTNTSLDGGSNIYVTHNGLLHNDVEVTKSLPSMTTLPQDVDSYAFLKLYLRAMKKSEDQRKNWMSVIKDVEGSYAVALYDPDPSNPVVHFARTFLGLTFAFFETEDGNYLAWASEASAFTGTGYTFLQEMNQDSILTLQLPSKHRVKDFDKERSSALHLKNMDAVDIRSYLGQCNYPISLIETMFSNPYVEADETVQSEAGFTEKNNKSCAVVFSGGLDSTTAAAIACRKYGRVALINFNYGAMANEPEKLAVEAVFKELKRQYPEVNLTLEYLPVEIFKTLGGSTLTDETRNKDIAEGEAGAERANEWVPARNTVFMSIAAAYCDRHNIDAIILGLNMEESAAYEDNSREFYTAFNRVLSLGLKSKTVVDMPLGGMMKSHIVKTAKAINAPIQHAWSCYKDGKHHCGNCGPCFLRMKAHAITETKETVSYLEYPKWFPDHLKKEWVF